jgi:hypothetical protein
MKTIVVAEGLVYTSQPRAVKTGPDLMSGRFLRH